MMHRISPKRISLKSTAAAFLVPWLVVAVSLGALAAVPSSAGASSAKAARSPFGAEAKLTSATRADDSGAISPANLTYEIPENGSLTEGDATDGYGPLVNDATDSAESAPCCTASPWSGATNDGTATVNSDGSFSYTPDSGFVGTDSFGYALSDNDGNQASGTVTVDVLDPAATTTVFTDTGTPPAASPSTQVTFAVQVTAKGGGPTPTGTVTFTWAVTNGIPETKTGTLGTEPLDSSGDASYAGTVPLGGQKGDITITATYSGDAFNNSSLAQTVYYDLASCSEAAWPADTDGQTVPLAKTSPTGYYIGQSNGWFTFYVVGNKPGHKTIFNGSIITNGLLIDINTIKITQHQDHVDERIGSSYSKIRYYLQQHGYVSGVSFYAGCGTYLKFVLDIGGAPAKKSEIFLGTANAHPSKVTDATTEIKR